MNNEERKLADVLHRVTPEPTRPVTVEQVAYRLVSEPRLGRPTRGREPAGPRPRRGGLGLSRAFAPALAAAAVVVIVGAGAGIAVLANSHHNKPSAGGAPASSTVSSTTASDSSSASPTQSSTEQNTQGTRIAGGPWGAELLGHQALNQGSLVSGAGALYAYGSSGLVRIDPATGAVTATASYNAPLPNPPVVLGNTVWVVQSNSGGNVVLRGYNAQTLAPTSTLQVPATGPVSSSASNVLTSGPDGQLYVAAGLNIDRVDPASGQVRQLIFMTGGVPANSLAVSPDGSTAYVGTGSSTSFKLLVYSLSGHIEMNATRLKGGGAAGDLVATSGGVWGTTGSGNRDWTWFAPNGDLTRAVQVGQGAGGGWVSYPSYSGGVVWVGGSGDLVCASPATGKVLAKANIPSDRGSAAYFGSSVVSGGRAYSYYETDASQQSGVALLSPPTACSGNVSS